MKRNDIPARPTSDEVFKRALDIIATSEVPELLEVFYREEHPKAPTTGTPYTLTGVLVAMQALALLAGNRLISDVFRTILDFTPEQAAACGMNYESLEPARTGTDYRRSESRFREWLATRLRSIDPDIDLPAQRRTNAEDDAVRNARTEEDWQRHHRAQTRRDTITNRLLAGSITPEITELITGADIITDETILDLVKHTWGMGAARDRLRGAAVSGRTYSRAAHRNRILNIDDATLQTLEDPKPRIGKAGFGIGITAVAVVGPPHDIYRLPQVVTGMAINSPEGASVAGLQTAIEAHQANGFDERGGKRSRLRYLTYDNGYTARDGCNEMALEHGYAAVFRYPSHWNTTEVSAPPPGATDAGDSGPVQIAGAFYCPAVMDRDVQRDLVHSGRDLLHTKGYDAHDRRLRFLLPFLMGVNSRPRKANAVPGRPAAGTTPAQVWKQQLVCPAALGRVRCRFQRNPNIDPGITAPRAEPTWQRDDYECCRNATVTVTFTDRQLKRAQLGQLVPGSWEHLIYYEAARSATERLFARLKGKWGSGLEHLHEGARREPFIALTVATSFAAANHWTIEKFQTKKDKPPNPARRKLKDLAKDLQREPTRTPARS